MLLIHDKITLNQVIDVFRGKANKGIKSKGLDTVKNAGVGSSYTKVDAERIMRYLIEHHVVREQTVKSTVGFPVTYIYLDEGQARKLASSKEKVVLSFADNVKTPTKADTSKRTPKAKKRGDATFPNPDDELLYHRINALRYEVTYSILLTIYKLIDCRKGALSSIPCL
jgi:superfamily II DNA helicase RecQ